MKKHAAILLLAALAAASCRQAHDGKAAPAEVFTTEVRLAFTPVKNQGNSTLCWAYAMLATIETEHIMMGDSVNLSPDYAARCLLADEARRCFLAGGRGGISMRGTAPLLLRIIGEYGIMPYDSYNAPRLNYNALARRLQLATATSRTLSAADSTAQAMLNEYIGWLPRAVYMLGAEYTPREFAHSVCMRGEYTALTSFTHHPFGEEFVLEVPDNRSGEMFLNVPIDELMHRIERSLRAGHPVCWEGDVSEPGFSFSRGTAVLPSALPCTQAERQKEFERLRTTDDHCMCLVGIAHDRQGRRFFIAKNSWGTGNPYGGLMYLSEDYVRMKTIAVVVKSLL